jgi:beta-ureidopropionase
MTARYEMYAKLLGSYVRPDFKPQLVSDPSP